MKNAPLRHNTYTRLYVSEVQPFELPQNQDFTQDIGHGGTPLEQSGWPHRQSGVRIALMAIRVVAFDVYGTLGRWAPGGVEPIEVQRLLTRFGIEISYEAYETARRAVMFFDSPKRPIVGWTDYLALLFARMNVAVSTDLLVSVSNMYETRHRFDLFSDALPAIEAARTGGMITCAFTTLPRFMVDGTGQGISARLHHYFDASAIGQPKGHPAFYRRIVERLGVAPSEILAVGDDSICDVELAIEAGWRVVLLDRDSKNTSAEAAQTEVIKSLAELPKHYSE